MKSKAGTDTEFFRTEKIPKILLQIAPPVMLAQLIQAMYNIVDSFFVGKYSEPALTALSVIYPLQLIIIALAVGTGVGVNTYMARLYAQKMPGQAQAMLPIGTWRMQRDRTEGKTWPSRYRRPPVVFPRQYRRRKPLIFRPRIIWPGPFPATWCWTTAWTGRSIFPHCSSIATIRPLLFPGRWERR